MFRINNIKIRDDISDESVLEISLKKLNIIKEDVLTWRVSKKSIDARNKSDVHYIYSIDLDIKNEKKYRNRKLEVLKKTSFPSISINKETKFSPVIIGSGPAGLFAAITLIQNGATPIIIEQGQPIEDRIKTIDEFKYSRKLNPNSNIQFGEGGAGTFSDGKLTTNINNPLCKKVLEEFVNFGAPEQILYLSKPHIGTDNLVKIIKNIREYIISNGGTFLFNEKVTDFEILDSKLSAVYCSRKINTDTAILAIGHSSHDTFNALHDVGVLMEQKNFSVGVRIEHLQSEINKAQYGEITKLKLPPSEYKFAYHDPSGRSCYTFCMCPGGQVMASSSDINSIVTNGMSNFLRDGTNSNSALLVNVTPQDFNSDSPLAGVEFQKEIEKKAFILGGSNYSAPIQRVEDFLINKHSTFINKIEPTYMPGFTFSNLNDLFPSYITDTLKNGIKYFNTKLNGFANPDSILTGPETRSSSPVKILRDDNFVSNISGLYPCGEGSGYAGGIMTAAVDGIRCALSLLKSK